MIIYYVTNYKMKKLLSSKENVSDSPPPDINNKNANKRDKFDHSVIKCKLSTILKNKDWLPEIKNIIKTINMIKTEAYFFFNQYIITCLNNEKICPHFNETTIVRCVLFVLGK